VPLTPAGRDKVLIFSETGATTSVIAADLLTVGRSLSWTVAVKLAVWAVVGAPEITPVEVVNESPAGSLPDVIDHV
jgi:hypothetical protein